MPNRCDGFEILLAAFAAAAMISFPPSVSLGSTVTAAPKDLHKAFALHIDGRRLVAADGREVQLRGVNLGGWLVTEDWMCGFEDSADDKAASGMSGIPGRHTEQSLQARFGDQKAAQLIDTWRDNWITAKDLDQIRTAGFNLVRVPIGYDLLMKEDGGWVQNSKGELNFSRMDWIVREAARRHIYVIFDLHVWPEQRHAFEKIGTADGAAIRQSMSQFWTAVAAHYRGEGAIAGFDLINEFPGAWGVQQSLSDSLRKEDPDRIQVIEGFTPEEFLTQKAAGFFANSIFSDHFYGDGPLTTDEISTRLAAERGVKVPVYIGEFLARDFGAATSLMNKLDVSWSSWTYKTVDMHDWGVFNYSASLRVNIQNDSFETLMTRWSFDLIQWQKPGSLPNVYINDDREPPSS